MPKCGCAEHQKAYAERKSVRLFSRLDDFATDHLYLTAGTLGAVLGFLSWYL